MSKDRKRPACGKRTFLALVLLEVEGMNSKRPVAWYLSTSRCKRPGRAIWAAVARTRLRQGPMRGQARMHVKVDGKDYPLPQKFPFQFRVCPSPPTPPHPQHTRPPSLHTSPLIKFEVNRTWID